MGRAAEEATPGNYVVVAPRAGIERNLAHPPARDSRCSRTRIQLLGAQSSILEKQRDIAFDRTIQIPLHCPFQAFDHAARATVSHATHAHGMNLGGCHLAPKTNARPQRARAISVQRILTYS